LPELRRWVLRGKDGVQERRAGAETMGKIYERIDDKLVELIGRQQMFFVATAPLSSDGLINLSPKGLDTFRILDDRTVAYLDLTGSGIETVAHVQENGRVVIMFCTFEGRPLIVRLHGRGTVHRPGDEGFRALEPLFPRLPGTRSIIEVDVFRIADSCGWGVPLYEFQGQRDQLVRYAEQLGEEKVRQAQEKGNARSLDGLPGITAAN
jgi:hypothetical protein